MDIDERHLLEETLELTRENNKILKSIRRSARWGRVIHALYWLIIIGVSVGAYYFVQPYLDAATRSLQSLKGSGVMIDNLTSSVSKLNASLPGTK